MSRTLRAVVVAALALGSAHAVPRSIAAFNGQVKNPHTFATTALYAPDSVTGTPNGSTVNLTWPAGRNGSAYRIERAANGASSNCTGASFVFIGTTTSLSYSDTPGSGGPWFCYRVVTAYGVWTSVNNNPVTAVQAGPFRVTGVSISNGGTAGKLDLGDRIVFTFSEAVNPSTAPSGTNTLCSTKAGAPSAQVLIGLTATAGACGTSQTLLLGRITGAGSDKDGRFEATWIWSAGNTVLTVTIGSTAAGGYPSLTGTLTFLPTTNSSYVRSQSGDVHVCDSGSSCQPLVTGGP